MSLENLKYWYDKDGNKVCGKKRSYNKCFEYLMSNNPKEVISKKGITIRKIFHPLFIKLLPITTKNKLKVVKKSPIPRDRKIIFVSTHGFRDDIAIGLKAAEKHSYLVYASLPDFYYSIDGLALWANGVYIMDRKDRESRKALLDKIHYGFSLGVKSVLIYPEGVWNKDPNEVVLNLWSGAYKAAIKDDALIIPIVSLNKDMDIDKDKRKACYASRGEAIDPSEYTEVEFLEYLRNVMIFDKLDLMKKYSNFKRGDIGDAEEYWDKYVSELIKTSNGLYDYSIENSAQYIDKTKITEKEVFAPLKTVKLTPENAKVLAKTYNIYQKKDKYYQ